MIHPSTKVSRASAIAGLVAAALYGVQELQEIPDLPTWLEMVLLFTGTWLATLTTGYQTNETNPAPSAIAYLRRRGRLRT